MGLLTFNPNPHEMAQYNLRPAYVAFEPQTLTLTLTLTPTLTSTLTLTPTLTLTLTLTRCDLRPAYVAFHCVTPATQVR